MQPRRAGVDVVEPSQRVRGKLRAVAHDDFVDAATNLSSDS
jgi:hypothetical protein